MVAGLVLSVAEGATPASWRWLLTDEDSGNPVADFAASVDRSAFEYAGFTDLYRFLRWNADPGRRKTSEAELVHRVGAWVGSVVLGGDVARVMAQAAPVSVRVVLPPELEFLLYRPLELAHVDGVPLVAQDVSLVFELPVADAAPGVGYERGKEPVGDALRVLGVFSAPTGASVLGLRRERHELARLARRLAARTRRAVEVEVLQYGVTRQLLEERAQDARGWDVLHLSGHGGAGAFLLEKPDGQKDPVTSAELVGLLRPVRNRVKLAVVTACESGAASVAETLHLLDLEEQARAWQQAAVAETGPASDADAANAVSAPTATAATGVGPGAAGVARELGRALGCAVVAMRYPVIDDFAIALTGEFYRLLWDAGQPVDAALRMAISKVTRPGTPLGVPAISLAVPALFGGTAAGLTLRPPSGFRPDLGSTAAVMAGFPDEPDRFVGRTAVMAEASAALAPDSGRSGVLVHGMAGAGKTACALELAYGHRDRFAAVAFWDNPKEPDGVFGALEDLAQRLDTQLSDYAFTMRDKVGTQAELQAFLPRLTQLLEDNGLLLVLDNLEHLLDEHGVWRDPRWKDLVAALTAHRGESRVLLTSRTRPAGLDADRVLVLPIHALSLAESALLVRELSHLRHLLGVEETSVLGDDQLAAGRDMLRRTLTVVQGHPKLLELADAAAADPDRLAHQLDEAERAATGGGAALGAFLTTGTTSLNPDAFLTQLTGWTTGAAQALPDASRLLLQMLCCLEDDDRTSLIVDSNWAGLWTRLQRPGDPPAIEDALGPLVAAALVHPDTPPAQSDGEHGEDGDTGQPPQVRYRIHPGVADTIRAAATSELRAAVDTELAAFWSHTFDLARQQPVGEDTWLVVYAGLAAAPYLMRLEEWDRAGFLLGTAAQRDKSPGTVRAVIPHLRRIADATGAPNNATTLAIALTNVDPGEAEKRLSRALTEAVSADDHMQAKSTINALINLLRGRGRLGEALQLTDKAAYHTREAGLGPANRIADRGMRLHILGELGKHRQVLDEVQALRPELDRLPDQRADNETIEPWIVYESSLDDGRAAAVALQEWETALELNRDVLNNKQRRGAERYEIAGAAFNSYGPLIRLGRLDEANQLLQACQGVFEEAADTAALGLLFSARADLENARDRPDRAAALERTAMRYKYTAGDWSSIATSHYNLAFYLEASGAPPEEWLADRLAAVAIGYAVRGPVATTSFTNFAVTLHSLGEDADAALPADFAELAARVETVEGVGFTQLITGLTGPDGGDQLLTDTLQLARELARELEMDADAPQSRLLAQWEPIIAAVVAAARGDTEAAAELDPALTDLANSEDWAALVGVLRRIIARERGQDLLAGLDPTDTAITARTLDALAGRVELTATPVDLHREDTDD
jgi:CHAT domain